MSRFPGMRNRPGWRFRPVHLRCVSDYRYRSNESVAAAWNSLDKSGIVRIVPERLPELGNRGAQTLPEIDKRVFRPKTLPKRLSIDDLPRTFQKKQ